MSLFQRAVWSAVSGIAITACGGEVDAVTPASALAESTDALYSTSGVTLWTSPSYIPVCWETPGFDTEKQLIRESLARTWEFESQVQFVWTAACPTSGTQKYVRVQLTNATDMGGGGSATEGMAALHDAAQGRSVHIAIPNPAFSNYLGRLQYLASHEFGHTLGFHHEQHRGDAPAPCNANIELGTTYTRYDPSSLMQSNCNVLGNVSENLSAFDKVGVASVYGPRRWTSEFPSVGATNEEGLRYLADVDGDGDDELIQFRIDGVRVATANATQRVFSAAQIWIADFGSDAGWVAESHPRALGDVNGDGRADVVGFGEYGVSLAYSTGSGFSNGVYSLGAFHRASSSWPDTVSAPRMVADVNGDGRADLVGFNATGTVVSLSQCQGVCNANTQFAAPVLALAAFGSSSSQGGWDGIRHPRRMADVNGDGKADIVGFSEWGVIVALSTSTATTVSFAPPALWLADFGADASVGGWSSADYPRRMGDLNGDGKADIIGFGHDYVWVAFSNGTTFLPAQRVLKNFTVASGTWISTFPRIVGDVDNDGKADLVGSSFLGTQAFLGKTFHPDALAP